MRGEIKKSMTHVQNYSFVKRMVSNLSSKLKGSVKGKKDDMNDVMNLLDREISIDGANSMDRGPYHM